MGSRLEVNACGCTTYDLQYVKVIRSRNPTKLKKFGCLHLVIKSLSRDVPGVFEPLSFFSQISAVFWHTYLYLFSAHVVKISDESHSRPGHQVTQSDVTSGKVGMFVIATPTDWSSWNLQRLISVTVSINCIPRHFDNGDPRSGQFCDLSLS